MCFFDGVGTLGEWVGGLGTVAAFIWTARSVRRTNDQAAADRRESELAQARLVTTHVEVLSNCIQVTVNNHSAQPVFSVTVLGLRIGPDNPETILHGDAFWPHIPPQSNASTLISASTPGPRKGTLGPNFRFEEGFHTFGADVEFVDWMGKSWTRKSNHEPEPGRNVPTRLPDHAPVLQPILPNPTLFD